jgi:hypothetical protein
MVITIWVLSEDKVLTNLPWNEERVAIFCLKPQLFRTPIKITDLSGKSLEDLFTQILNPSHEILYKNYI